MAITDANGNKLPQPRIHKKVFAKNVRERRVMKQKQATSEHPANLKHCSECGFRVRSVNHMEGKHHSSKPM